MATESQDTTPGKSNKGIYLLRFAVALTIVLATGLGFIYILSPTHIRKPVTDHLHFRMNLVVDGTSVDFSKSAFQTDYKSDSCSSDLTKQPIHFHDSKNQYVHIHWKGITGGEVLKNYGMNLIGGPNDTLGWRFDKANILSRVKTHGDNLPKSKGASNYYIYTSDGKESYLRTTTEFLKSPLSSFFEGGKHDSQAAGHSSGDQTQTKLNNVVGDVVIFAQKDQPTNQQIRAKFEDLEPLPDSQCAG